MTDNPTEARVAAHYARADLTRRILDALAAAGIEPVTPEALSPLDHLHHGGLGLTQRLVRLAGIKPAMRVLDAGSGVGGPARYLAQSLGCRIDCIDLSPDFVATAQDLDRLTGLADLITQQTGSVTALPYADASFDAAISMNVTMNIADKPAMFAEVFRTLRPGGTFAFTHLAGGRQPIDYPTPWAMTAETSFVASPAEIAQLLSDAGFRQITDHAKDAPLPPPPADSLLDDSIAMGADMPLRRANVMRAVQDGRLIPMMVTARRP